MGAEDHGPMTTEFEDRTERRLQMQVYHEWTRVAAGKPFPTMQDMEGIAIEGLRKDSVILRLADDPIDPEIEFVGENFLRDCGAGTRIARLADVPGLSLLSRFTDTYLQCVANRAPVGFEAGFTNRLDEAVQYRGILLPISSDGQQVDAVWGVSSSTFERAGKDAVAVTDRMLNGSDLPSEAASLAAEAVTPGKTLPLDPETIAYLARGLAECRDIDGLLGLALVAVGSGDVCAQVHRAAGFDLPRVARSGAELIRLKREVMVECALEEDLSEAIVTTRHAFWIVQPLEGNRAVMVLFALDRSKANLAGARHRMGQALSAL